MTDETVPSSPRKDYSLETLCNYSIDPAIDNKDVRFNKLKTPTELILGDGTACDYICPILSLHMVCDLSPICPPRLTFMSPQSSVQPLSSYLYRLLQNSPILGTTKKSVASVSIYNGRNKVN